MSNLNQEKKDFKLKLKLSNDIKVFREITFLRCNKIVKLYNLWDQL